VAILGEMAIRMSFASRGSERREWRRIGLTRTSTTLPMVYLSLVCRCPGAKASVRTIRAWGEWKAVGSAAAQATPVRPVWGTGQTGACLDRQQFGFRARTGARVVSGGRGSGGWAGEFAEGQVPRHSPPSSSLQGWEES
jgi:hypothetical protein